MNRLAEEKSPYLLQHKANPVEWRPWSEEAFSEAKRLNKPVFLSVGYSTCHWCHVMAHESFENPEIARLMNENFVNIKVDREERPDVDRLYMAFVQATTGSGGWPMSVWLTPEGRPFYGGTYFPPDNRYGRAGFPSILTQIARLWQQDRERIETEAARVIAALAEAGKGAAGAEFREDDSPLVRGFEDFSRSFDEDYGGFGGAPEISPAFGLQFSLSICDTRNGRQSGPRLRKWRCSRCAEWLLAACAIISVEDFTGIRSMSFGTCRISRRCSMIKRSWRSRFSRHGNSLRDEFFANIARETLDYVLRDMTHPEGGFFSAEDADSLLAHGRPEHAEGAYYVWSRQEIVEVLGAEEARIFCRHYGVEENGNAPAGSDPHGEFRGKNILIEKTGGRHDREDLESPGRNGLRDRSRLARRKLFDRRAQRPRPHLDDKVLTAWNGLAISAFAKCGAALERASLPRSCCQGRWVFAEAAFFREGASAKLAWRGQRDPRFCRRLRVPHSRPARPLRSRCGKRLVEMGAGISGATGSAVPG